MGNNVVKSWVLNNDMWEVTRTCSASINAQETAVSRQSPRYQMTAVVNYAHLPPDWSTACSNCKRKSCRQCTLPGIQLRSIMAWQELLNNQLSLPNVSTVSSPIKTANLKNICRCARVHLMSVCGTTLHIIETFAASNQKAVSNMWVDWRNLNFTTIIYNYKARNVCLGTALVE